MRILTGVVLAALTVTVARAQAPAAGGDTTVVTNVAANINLTPHRVTFDPSHRNATIFVINQGGAPVTVDIAMVDRIMTDEGKIVAAEEAAGKPELAATLARLQSAKEMLQVSPRRVTLMPSKGQTIRVRLASLPPTPAAAEYRTHLTVTTVPPPDSGVTADAAASTQKSKQLSFRINAVYGVSVPAIVRTQPAQPQVELTKLHLTTVDIPAQPNAPAKRMTALAVDIVRHGSNSLYGALEVRLQGQKRDDAPLGVAKGVGVYPEIDHRTVQIPLSRAPAPGEKLEVTFTDDDTSPGKVLAKSSL